MTKPELSRSFTSADVSVKDSLSMGETDAAIFIEELYALMLTMVPPDEIDTLEELIKYDKESRNPDHENKLNFFGAYRGQELVGFACRSTLEHGGGFSVYLGVDPVHRSTREVQTPYASQLIGAMEHWVASVQTDGKNINFVELEPPGSDTANSRLRSLERLGFVKIDIPTYAYKSPSTDELGFGEDGCNTSWLGVKQDSLPNGVLTRDDFLEMTLDLHNQLNGTHLALSDFEENPAEMPKHLLAMYEDVKAQKTIGLTKLTDPSVTLTPLLPKLADEQCEP